MQLLEQKYENHPEVLRVNIELKRVLGELDGYRNFYDLGERDVLMEEIQDLRNQLQYYMDSSSSSNQNRSPLPKLTHASQPVSAFHGTKTDLTKESADEKLEQERRQWTETESKWISIAEELRLDLEASRSLAEKLEHELDCERKCTEELKEALQTAMQGHARILEQYADLQEKHMALLGRHRKISDGIADVKRAAAKAGVKGAESKFINSLAAEISAIKVEREKERQYWRDENKGLQAQLRDTAEAVQAAGELLVRLKEAEEAAAIAQVYSYVAILSLLYSNSLSLWITSAFAAHSCICCLLICMHVHIFICAFLLAYFVSMHVYCIYLEHLYKCHPWDFRLMFVKIQQLIT